MVIAKTYLKIINLVFWDVRYLIKLWSVGCFRLFKDKRRMKRSDNGERFRFKVIEEGPWACKTMRMRLNVSCGGRRPNFDIQVNYLNFYNDESLQTL